ncbi:MAG: ribonuclease HI family protein [Candidatus Gracilibacteria bacterium]|nr:ribonuclease HI family protein [Candidatus Gracilibacteria bacterium]
MTKLIVYSDGGARGNPGPAGLGVYICTPEHTPVERRFKYLGETTNNVAEYSGALLGIERAIALGATEIELRADSKLVIEQLKGNYKVKNLGLKEIHTQIQILLQQASVPITFTHVPREKNKEADRLSNVAMDQGIYQ